MSIDVFAVDAVLPGPLHPALGPWPHNSDGHAPDARAALLRDGAIVARLSIWRRGTTRYRGCDTHYLGHVAAVDQDALTTLLAGIAELEVGGSHVLLGPIDGSTWNRYRVVTDEGDLPPFPLEPTNPAWWADAFAAAGYSPIERYWSGVRDVQALPCEAPAPTPRGVTIRELRTERLADELNAIYALALEAFAANPLYTPIGPERFRAMYEPLAEHLDPRLCLIAERGDPIGLMMCIPADRSRLVLKTIAVASEERCTGIGRILLDAAAHRGQTLGYRSLIYALMRDDNRSSAMAQRVAAPMRRYALYAYGSIA